MSRLVASRSTLLAARRLRFRKSRCANKKGGGSERDFLNSIFSRADTSGDGILSRTEHEAFLSYEKLTATADSAGGVTQDVFRRVLSPGARRGASASGSLAKTVAEQTTSAGGSTAIQPKQYALMSLKSGLPFVAFGFVDNAIMIMAGDMIEASIGTTLALSTMAAAGIGNMFSDVIGIAATDVIEQVCEKLGLPSANLTAAQLLSQGARTCHVLSQAFGIAIGCILGLAPLLFLDQEARLLRSCFDQADVDGDGELTAQEITMGFHRFGLMVHQEAVHDLMTLCDTDHSGTVSYPEFVHLIETHSRKQLQAEILAMESKSHK